MSASVTMEMQMPMHTLKQESAAELGCYIQSLPAIYSTPSATPPVTMLPLGPHVINSHAPLSSSQVSLPATAEQPPTYAVCTSASALPLKSVAAGTTESHPEPNSNTANGEANLQMQEHSQLNKLTQGSSQRQVPFPEALDSQWSKKERVQRLCVNTEAINDQEEDDPSESSETELSRKRPRVDITNEQKRQICLYHNENSKATGRQIVDYFRRQWGITLGRSTIASLIGQKDKWLCMSEDKGKAKRARVGHHQEMEQQLHSWYTSQRGLGLYISRDQLFAKAKEIGAAVGIPATFTYSKGWLQKFQTRYNFRITAEKSKTDAASRRFVRFRRKQLDRDLEETPPAELFCCAEFPLLHDLTPQTPASNGSPLSVCLCINSTGSTRLPPLVVGRATSCGFSSRFSQDKLLMYRCSMRGRLTEAHFCEWLYSMDERMRRERRFIVLLLGATSCSVERSYRLTNIKLRYCDTVGARCPMQLGIKEEFKIGYRLLQCQHWLSDDAALPLRGPDLRTAMYLIRESWLRLSESLVAAAWVASCVLPDQRLTEALTNTDAVSAVSQAVATSTPASHPPPQMSVSQPVTTFFYQSAPQQQLMHHQSPAPPLQQPPSQHYGAAETHGSQQQQQQQQYFHAAPPEQQPTLTAYDPSLGQTYVTFSNAYIIPEQALYNNGDQQLPPPPQLQPAPAAAAACGPLAAPLPRVDALLAASRSVLQTQMSRLPIPVAELMSVEALLAADERLSARAEPPDLSKVKEECAVSGQFVDAAAPVPASQARWAADLLLQYLEQRDAELADIDTLLELRRRYISRQPGSESNPAPT